MTKEILLPEDILKHPNRDFSLAPFNATMYADRNIYKLCSTLFNMKKIIKKYGNTLVISFSPEECKIVGMDEGDIIDFEIQNIESKQRSRR